MTKSGYATGGIVRSVEIEDNPYRCFPVSILLDIPCLEFYTEEERKEKLRILLDRLNEYVLD